MEKNFIETCYFSIFKITFSSYAIIGKLKITTCSIHVLSKKPIPMGQTETLSVWLLNKRKVVNCLLFEHLNLQSLNIQLLKKLTMSGIYPKIIVHIHVPDIRISVLASQLYMYNQELYFIRLFRLKLQKVFGCFFYDQYTCLVP